MMSMDLFIYFLKSDDAAQRFNRQIDLVKTGKSIEKIHSIKQLERRFRGPQTLRGNTIAVLFAADRQELAKLFSIRDLMDGCRIILILPDSRKETVSAGHRLRPRYVSYAGGSLEDVTAVLQKMMEQPFINLETRKQEVVHGA